MRTGLLALLLGLLFSTAFSQQFITLIGHHPGDTALGNTEVWGYEDSITGKPYALMGTWSDLLIFDVSDPANPVLTSRVTGVKAFDFKIWDHYAYVCSGTDADSIWVVDLTDITNPQVIYSWLPGAHNLWVDEKGYLYTTHRRIRIFDLNVDPVGPPLLWTGGVEGHDMHVFGDTLVYFAGYNGTYLFDITNRQFPIPYGLVFDPNMVYHHSGWLTPDGTTLFIDDELAKDTTADITAWNITDPDNPQRIGEYTDTNAIVHNLYLKDRFAFTSYYKRGLRIFDVADPTNIHLVGEYKTYPGPVEESFGGAFGVYIFAPSGYVYVSDGDGGLFIFDVDLALGMEANDTLDPTVQLWPNPVKDQLNLSFPTETAGVYSLEIRDLEGRQILRERKHFTSRLANPWQLDLTGLSAGTYLAMLRDPVGRMLTVSKVIKE